jgi:outer membrane protein OmpA-like peptidoglycan-associated protein
MKKTVHIFLLVIFLGLGFSLLGFAQSNRNLQSGNTNPTDTITKYDGKVLYFRGINQEPYYHDPGKLAQINKFYKDGNLKKAYDLLYDYVMNFGVKNFYKELYLVWRLGKLAQELQYFDKAKIFYRIVLKHHPGANDRDLRLFYDSLSRNDLDYYLPVEYYYTYANAASLIDTLQIPASVYTSLGDSVNSKYNDYAPALAGNDLILIFSSQRNRKRSGMRYVANEDLYYTRKADSLFLRETEQGAKFDTIPWTRAKPLPGINTEYNEGSAYFTKSGTTMYFTRCESNDGFGNCDIYIAKKQKNGVWGKIKNLGINVNSMSWDSHPSLSHTEDTLFFASDRIGGFGMSDIYFTYKTGRYEVDEDSDTTWFWSPAQNLGPIVNTRHNEVSPFYHPVYDYLYFSSNGQLVNFGGFDIYKTTKYRLDWTEPKNLGPLVNYKTDEYYFTIDSKARNLYYAKSIPVKVYDGFKGDSVVVEVLQLHTAYLPMEAQPLATVKFEGVVKDSITGKAFEGIVSIIDLDEGIEVAPKYLRPDGSYRFDLIRDHNYLVVITGEDFFRIERQFLLKDDTTMVIETPSIKFKKWQFEAIEFTENSSEVTAQMQPDLEKLVLFMADHPNIGLKISGHTDSQGSMSGNMKLSQARADAIKNYIINRGKFKPDRIEAKGYGSTRPIIQKEETDEHRHINRRVEFELVKLK